MRKLVIELWRSFYLRILNVIFLWKVLRPFRAKREGGVTTPGFLPWVNHILLFQSRSATAVKLKNVAYGIKYYGALHLWFCFLCAFLQIFRRSAAWHIFSELIIPVHRTRIFAGTFHNIIFYEYRELITKI